MDDNEKGRGLGETESLTQIFHIVLHKQAINQASINQPSNKDSKQKHFKLKTKTIANFFRFKIYIFVFSCNLRCIQITYVKEYIRN